MVVLDGISSSGYTASSSSSSSRPSDSSERGPTTVLDSKFLVEKQKSPSHDSSSGGNGSSGGTEDRALLPPQIWHHIFTFCPPRSLGVLLSVNKLFNLYLDPASPVRREAPAADPFKSGALVPLKPNAIWQASRRLFWPIMPAPLQSKTELDMWRLACSNRCQICGKSDGRDSSPPFDVRNPGPGPDGVAALWAFGARMCASCLIENSTKEVDLLISPTIPSAVASALAFVFLTPDFQALSATALETAQLPVDLQLTKLFSSLHVKELEREYSEVKDMGVGTVNEWLKGLGGRGKDARQDASKWEKWESSGGTARMCSQLYPGHVRGSSPVASSSTAASSAATDRQLPHGRQERTVEEVTELKVARRAEIERRALLLDPPLTPNVLRHIPSFQAATQIVHPLDDSAWEILKPRLISQRAEAEQREREAALAQTKQQPHLETTLASAKEARDLVDKDWEQVQGPLRGMIAGYADEVIRDRWAKGKKVSKENCSRFAIEALAYVRERFYAEVAKNAAAAEAAGQTPHMDPPDGPFTQKLTLENMKWIFDTKIKLHTDAYRKELFYCNGCEGNTKSFGFEGVIQHYAAKHTSALSLGSIVVYWRAEWPAHPPFAAEARPARAPMFFGHAAPVVPPGGIPPPMNHIYPPAPALVPPPPSNYGYGNAAYVDPYHPPPPQPFTSQPPPVHPHLHQPPYPPAPAFEHHALYGAAPETYHPPYQSGHGIPFPGTTVQGYLHPPHPPPPPPPPQNGHQEHSLYPPYAPPQNAPYGLPQAPPYPIPHVAMLEDIARNSREVWQSLANIRDLPGGVRVFVTIHHLVKRFRARFYETPSLAMFIDGLSNNKDMRPVRNVNGLVCRACHLGLGNAPSVEQDRTSYSLPQLTNHFQTKHIEPMQRMQVQPLDWVLDMVLVPSLSSLTTIPSAVNASQRALIAEALPDIFHRQSTAEAGSHRVRQVVHHPIRALTGGPQSKAPPEGRAAPETVPALRRAVASATPTADSDNAQLGSGQSRQGSGHNRGHIGPHSSKKVSGKNKRKRKLAGEDEGGRRAVKESRRSDSGRQLEESDISVRSPPSAETAEPDIMAALESHLLGQRQPPHLHLGISSAPRHTSAFPVRQSEAQASHGEARARQRGPPDPQQEEPRYRARPEYAQRQAQEYDRRPSASFVEPISRHPDDAQHNRVAQSDEEYLRYRDERRTQSRPAVETYEIVHVIDGQESYYIRRPVRREPSAHYIYEEPFPAYEGTLALNSRSSVAREGIRGHVVPERRPTDHRGADLSYLDEYDPRFGR